jgi:hypothetical protein
LYIHPGSSETWALRPLGICLPSVFKVLQPGVSTALQLLGLTFLGWLMGRCDTLGTEAGGIPLGFTLIQTST